MFKLSVVDFKCSNLEVLAIPVCEDAENYSDEVVQHLVNTARTLTGFDGKIGEIKTIFSPSGTSISQVVFFGLGKFREIDPERLRLFGGRVVTHCIDLGLSHMVCAMPSINKTTIKNEDVFTAIVEGIVLGNNVLGDYKTKKDKIPLTQVTLAVSDEKQLEFSVSVSKTESICNATILVRQWVNMPSNYKTPEKFAKILCDRAAKTDLTVNVFNESWLIDKKFGSMLAVGYGSDTKSCLVTLDYNPPKFEKTILLVGKGITFDSGGINLKPSAGLEEMKTDMSGAATVGGTLIGISKLKPQIRVVGVIPLVENMPSGSSMRPGDNFEAHPPPVTD